MISKAVCIIGCGPIGLTGALLLAKLGVPTLLLERRGELNTHPRSRFVDTNTMELMRLLGIEKEVEQTGLGPDWTAFNRWCTSLTGKEHAAIPSPTFHSVRRSSSPCIPVMTCQDYVEAELLKLVDQADLIDCRFNTEAFDVSQTDDAVELKIRNLETGAEERVSAHYLIGADGPHSRTRAVIGSELESDPLEMYSQDVIFEADLSAEVGERKGALLYCATSEGVLTFQPLNGIRRWRCQIFKPQEADLSESEILHRIRLAVGADVPIELRSIGNWQPTPGCTSKFRGGRIFLAGDAAHISVPTGGMGNNIGFSGIRNLTWKLAFMIQGYAGSDILETYESELKPAALKRIAHGVDATNAMRQLFTEIYGGEDCSGGAHATRKYGDYDGTILGHEMQSSLIAPEAQEAPPIEDPVTDYAPLIRNGRRAPHIWLDDGQSQSMTDWFSTTYTLVAGSGTATEAWQVAVNRAAEQIPITLRALPSTDKSGIYRGDGLVLVRPDGVIADHWLDDQIGDAHFERLIETLPIG